MSQYEAWCHACNVTFPPQTKQCLHCGQRTRPDPPGGSMRGIAEQRYRLQAAEEDARWDDVGATPVIPDPREDRVEPEEEPARRSLLRAGMTFVWMILLAGAYAWRACSEQ